MRANFEPGSFFGEMLSGGGSIGITADRDEVHLHITDLCVEPGQEHSHCSIPLSDEHLDKLQTLLQVATAWRRGEKRDREAEKAENYWPGYRDNWTRPDK
ncbi:MAG: hypothetical protein GY922_09975 [Proteobacteria bacterium]|nr:hypothetical protein [Pseudomonadota bacterium]